MRGCGASSGAGALPLTSALDRSARSPGGSAEVCAPTVSREVETRPPGGSEARRHLLLLTTLLSALYQGPEGDSRPPRGSLSAPSLGGGEDRLDCRERAFMSATLTDNSLRAGTQSGVRAYTRSTNSR